MMAKAEREARLAAQLRENLKRRKVAARAGGQDVPQPDATALCSRAGESPGDTPA